MLLEVCCPGEAVATHGAVKLLHRPARLVGEVQALVPGEERSGRGRKRRGGEEWEGERRGVEERSWCLMA